jgi:nitroreductase
MNILNAAHALGFGAKWVTGENTYDADFRRDFGLADTDRLLGFIRLGSAQQIPEVPRPEPAQFMIEWSGPAD